jgi:hypothetical protein
MVIMYDKIWSDFHESYTPLKYEDLYQIFIEAKAILNERYIWFAIMISLWLSGSLRYE